MEKNFIVNNIEKIVFFLLFIAAAALFGGYQKGLYLKGIDVQKKLAGYKFIPPPTSIEGIDTHKETIVELSKTASFSDYEACFERQAFSKFFIPPPVVPLFEYESCSPVYMDIVYKGYIQSLAGVVGQIKVDKRSYFVREKERIADYTVVKIRKDYAVVENTAGKEIRLPLRERILGDDYQAVLFVTGTGETVNVKRGDVIENFKVLDITPTCVVLYNEGTHQRLVIKLEAGKQ
ncbi:MAG: hypothetical protein KAJ66_05820 [Candidatus Omnitrophica bacterium]|nr:hypothetical protein [Candidatus Omnitrophota bacterium]